MNGGELIKKIRISLCLEQQEFAKKIGVSKYSVSNYESGNRKPRLPILRNIIAIANAHNMNLKAEDFFP